MSLPMEISLTHLLQSAFESGDSNSSTKTVEQSNVRALQELYESLLQNNLSAFAAFLTPDVELEIHCPQEFPFVSHARGVDEVCAAVEKNFAAVAEQSPELLSVVAQGNTVVLFAREKGLLIESQLLYDIHFVQQFTFHEGRLQRIKQIGAFSV